MGNTLMWGGSLNNWPGEYHGMGWISEQLTREISCCVLCPSLFWVFGTPLKKKIMNVLLKTKTLDAAQAS